MEGEKGAQEDCLTLGRVLEQKLRTWYVAGSNEREREREIPHPSLTLFPTRSENLSFVSPRPQLHIPIKQNTSARTLYVAPSTRAVRHVFTRSIVEKFARTTTRLATLPSALVETSSECRCRCVREVCCVSWRFRAISMHVHNALQQRKTQNEYNKDLTSTTVNSLREPTFIADNGFSKI